MMRAVKFVAALIGLAGAAAAWGQDGRCGKPDEFRATTKIAIDRTGYDMALQALRHCFGDSISDDNEVTVAFNTATPHTDSDDDRAIAVVTALTQLRNAAAKRESKGVDPVAWQRVVIELNRELDEAEAARS